MVVPTVVLTMSTSKVVERRYEFPYGILELLLRVESLGLLESNLGLAKSGIGRAGLLFCADAMPSASPKG